MTITNCYWSGTTDGTIRTGTFRGGYSIKNNNNNLEKGVNLTNSYYNKDLFTLSVPQSVSGIGLETDQFKDSGNFENWDFVNDWYIGEENYPELIFRNK